jgi:ANTAR domain
MVEPILTQTRAETEPREPTVTTSKLHLVSGEDAIEAADRDDHLDAILARGDIRDQAAERRDRRADRRPCAAGDNQALTDRTWAGRDRDSAAADRADLVGLLQANQGMVLVIDKAQGILMARRGCTPQEAFSLLSTAAKHNELTVGELAECLVTELDLR